MLKISSNKILKRLNFKEKEIPNYEMLALFSGVFFVVNFTLREKLMQNYTPTKIKCIVEHALFIKSSYSSVPVILTHKRNPVDSIIGSKRTLFQISSFTDQEYEVTLLQKKLGSSSQ